MNFASYCIKDLQKLLKAKAKAKAKGEQKEVASCCNVLGELFQQQGKYEEAISEHKEERSICEALKDTIGIAIAHRKIGEALNELGKYESALEHQHKYFELAKNASNKLEVQRALATIGRTHFCHAEALTTNNRTLYDGALASSKKAYEKSLELCNRLKIEVTEREYMQMKCRLLLNLGLVCDLQAQDNEAINFFKKTIYIADKYQFREDLHRCHYSLALFYSRRKNFSQAKREVELAERVAFQLKDKALICDDLSLKAQLFVVMADFESARRYLVKAYRQKTPVAMDREKIEADLRLAIRLCKLQEMSFTVPSHEGEKLIRILEKQGDLCSSLKAFPRAIDFYEKMLQKAQELNWKAKDLIAIYVSLSQTYMDDKNFKKAIEYYNLELEEYSDNPAEACRTILNIANAREEDGASYCELEPFYQKALILAEEANNPRLKATTLNSLAVLQETNGYFEKSKQTAAQVSQICEEHNIDLDDESDVSPSQSNRCDLLEDDTTVDLDELIDDDSDEEDAGSKGGRRRAKKSIEKLNMKGETALHRACIKQDLSAVRLLLQQKHQVNVRDNCGWTPLHEACNYGNVDIVKLLIEHGAAVNDRGGKHCEGITPLHDAASCGHIDVMAALLQNGANPLCQTHHGESAYECLVNWRLRTGGDLDSRILKQCLAMEEKLTGLMKNAGQKVPTVKDIEHKQSSSSALIPEERVQVSEEPEVKFLEEEVSFARSESYTFPAFKERPSTSAQKEYASAMRIIGCSAKRLSLPAVQTSVKKSRPLPALLPEEDMDDEWLEKDIPSPVKKPAKKTNSRNLSMDDERDISLPSSLINKTNKGQDMQSNSTPKPTAARQRWLSLSSDDDCVADEVMPPSAKRSRSSPTFLIDTDEDSRERPFSPILSGAKRSKLKLNQLPISSFTTPLPDAKSTVKKATQPQAAPPQVAQPQVAPPILPVSSNPVLKLYVKIQDKVLLIPVDHSRTLQWLAEEAARRYYNMTGLNPVLSLQTEDGAVLNGDDVVSVILRDGEKVVGQIDKWDLQPLPERYSSACRQMEIVRIGQVETVLTDAHISGALSLTLSLGSKHLSPVVRALRYQQNLWDLKLSSTKMDDAIFKNLCEALSTLPHLIHLDLHSNSITSAGLVSLSDMLQTNNDALKKLQTLNLSFNPLGDGSAFSLSTCLEHLTALSSVQIESCGLTDRFVDDRILSVVPRIQLKKVDIGWNEWSTQSLTYWLQMLDISQLNRLSVAAPLSDRVATVLVSGISLIDRCALHHLDLSNCNLTDASLKAMTSVFHKMPQLKGLVLRNNPGLSIDILVEILICSQSQSVYLEELDFLGCCLSFGESLGAVNVADVLRSYLNWSRTLRLLSLSVSQSNSPTDLIPLLTDVWTLMHPSDGVVRHPTAHQLVLSLSKV